MSLGSDLKLKLNTPEHTGPTSRPTTTCQTNSSRSSSTRSTCSTAAEYFTRRWAGAASIDINGGVGVEQKPFELLDYSVEGKHGLLAVTDASYIDSIVVVMYQVLFFFCPFCF